MFEKRFKGYVRWTIENEQQAIRDGISDMEKNNGFPPVPSLAVKIVRETGKTRRAYLPGMLSEEKNDTLVKALIAQEKLKLLTVKELDDAVDRRLSKINAHGIPNPTAWTQMATDYKTWWDKRVSKTRSDSGKIGAANLHATIQKAKAKGITNPIIVDGEIRASLKRKKPKRI